MKCWLPLYLLITQPFSASAALSEHDLKEMLGMSHHAMLDSDERKLLADRISSLTPEDAVRLKEIILSKGEHHTTKSEAVDALRSIPAAYEDSTPFLTQYADQLWLEVETRNSTVGSLLRYFEKADPEQAAALAFRCLATTDMGLRSDGESTLKRLGVSNPGLKEDVAGRLPGVKGLLFPRQPVPVWRKTVRSPWFWAGTPGVLGAAGVYCWWRRKKKQRTTP